MRLPTVSFTLLFAAAASATTVSYIDPFGSAATACASPACDVMGNKSWYDLDRVSFAVNSLTQEATVTASFNFGPNDSLAPFYDHGVRLDAADMLFTVNGTIRFGVPLTPHASAGGIALRAGALYTALAPGGILTAYDVLQLRGRASYRPAQPVWLNDDGHGSLAWAGGGSVAVAQTGDGVTSGRLTVTLMFATTPTFIQDFERGALGIRFASSTGANDILSARLTPDTPTPEPPGRAVGGLFLMLLATVRRMPRRRSAGFCGPAPG